MHNRLPRPLPLLALLALAVPAVAAEAARPVATEEDRRLERLLEEEWEWRLHENPVMATRLGDSRYDDALIDMSPAALERRKAHERELKDRLQKIDRTHLSAEAQLNYDLALYDAKLDVEGQRFAEELLALNQLGGVHTVLAALVEDMPRNRVKDFDNLLARLAAYPTLVDQHIALLKKGLEQGVTAPQVTLAHVSELIANQIVEDPTKSPIYEMGFANLPKSFPAAERTRLQAAAKRAIAESVVRPLRRFHTFVTEEYVPKARKALGASSLPDGQAWYAYLARASTTTTLTPERIHQIGLDEVARIRKEMEKVMRKAEWKGSLESFFQFLRTDPRFYFTDKESLIVAYRDISKRIDPGLPHLFGHLPRLTYGVRAVPAYSEKTQTTAYYTAGSPEAGRPGYFNANTYDLKTRPRWEMETLTLHEAVPGHHLQIAIAQELDDLPKFRRHGHYTAYVEGWALYGESLGEDLGMFQDPYSKFGNLTYEMWRAIRLVLDTGLHTKGWTRDQAIDFFKKNAPKTLHDIEVEVDRYIVWPGQALAYKIGELKIKELRALAQKRMGAKFDLRTFHDVILDGGALPLDVLEARVKSWIDGKLVLPKR